MIMPYSTVERVDCMVTEQYNSKALRGESTLSTERSNLAGVASGDRRHYHTGRLYNFINPSIIFSSTSSSILSCPRYSIKSYSKAPLAGGRDI